MLPIINTSSLRIFISDSIGEVSAEVIQPDTMKALMVMAHGAGAGMNHLFMTQLAYAWAALSIGSLRYNFPYMEMGKKRPDPPALAERTVRVVMDKAHELFTDTCIIGAGKSFGGRMTSQYLSQSPPDFVKGMVFVGFPLHPAGEPGTTRADHLSKIKLPMLFLQGTRDALAELPLITRVTAALPKASLVLFEKADHSFKVGKRDFINEISQATKKWIDERIPA